jgi:hypothetical protein
MLSVEDAAKQKVPEPAQLDLWFAGNMVGRNVIVLQPWG